MLCGSCIRDNALARSLAGRGHDAIDDIPKHAP